MAPPPRRSRRPRRQPSSSPTPAAARESRPRAPGRGEVHAPMACRSTYPRPAPGGAKSADPPAAAHTTIDSLVDDTVNEILLRLPSSASLARAVLSARWGRIALEPGFLESFRKLHPSSALIGMYACDDANDCVSLPMFHPVNKRDRDIKAVTLKGDVSLARLDDDQPRLDDDQRWCLRDCRNGVLLLLCRDNNSMRVYNPVSGGLPVQIQARPNSATIEGEFVADCLLDGTVQYGQRVAVDSFRVVSVQQRSLEIRAVEYNSSTSKWHCHPWVSLFANDGLSRKTKWGMPMYAAGRIFWNYGTAYLIVLDARASTMEFKSCPLPSELVEQKYSIGEIEDGTSYLVRFLGLVGKEEIRPRLQVWSLNADNGLELELKKEVHMSQLFEMPYSTHVCKVVNGLAVMTCLSNRWFVVDLLKETLLAKFKFSGRGYPYQLSWPPSIPPLKDSNINNLLPTSEGNRRSSHEEGDGNERSKLSLGNTIKDNTCSQSQYVDPPDVDEGSGNEAEPCENHHSLKSADTPKDDGPPKRKKWKTNVTSNACLEETTMGHQDQHMPSLSSCDPIVVESETVPHSKGGRRTQSSHAVHDSTSVEAAATSLHIHEKSVVHVEVGTETDKMIKCHFKGCTSKFSKRFNLNRHVRVVHGQGNVFPCKAKACYKTFASTTQLNNHFVRKHKRGETHLVCQFEGCNEDFATKHERTIHEKSDEHVELDGHGAERIKCPGEGCTLTFSRKDNQGKHFREVHRQGYIIPINYKYCDCGEKFTTTGNLKRHVESQHKSKETRFMCRFEGCNQEFDTKHRMMCHEKSDGHVIKFAPGAVEKIKCTYKGCKITFSQRAFHNTHVKRFHPELLSTDS